jgi:hypothetical protein
MDLFCARWAVAPRAGRWWLAIGLSIGLSIGWPIPWVGASFAQGQEPGSATRSVLHPPSGVSAASPASPALPALPASPGPSRKQPSVHDAMARYAHEPTVEWVVQAVWAHHTVHPDTTDRLASRARASGWVPQLRILGRAASIQGQNERLTETPWASWTDSRNYSVVVALTMRLDRMMFTPDESSLLRQKDQLRHERWEMAKHVSKVYFERRRLQVERDLDAHTTNERDLDGLASVERELKIAELEALLNAWTRGEFAAKLRSRAIGR